MSEVEWPDEPVPPGWSRLADGLTADGADYGPERRPPPIVVPVTPAAIYTLHDARLTGTTPPREDR